MRPPSIEKSGVAFEPDTTDDGKPAVRWGMGSIKGLGSYAAPLVRSTRGKGITKIEDLAKALAPFGNASGQARALAASGALDRKSVGKGKRGAVRGDHGGRRIVKKK